MLTIKFILKLIGILNKDASPRAIAGGVALGSIAGLTPFASLHNLLVLILVTMLPVNFASALVSLALFGGGAFLLDPLFNKIGYFLLTGLPALKPFWTALYNTPVIPWTNFNNTLTLGSLVFALLLFWPFYFFSVWAVINYREILMAKIEKWKIVQILKTSSVYTLYQKFS